MSSTRALQGCCRRKYSPLFTFQKRLRHVRGVSFRNLVLPENYSSLQLELRTLQGTLVAKGDPLGPDSDPSWDKLDITAGHASKGVVVIVLADDRPLLEWTVFLSGLVFVSRHLPCNNVNFAPNSLLLLLPEGIYCDKNCFETANSNSIAGPASQHYSVNRPSFNPASAMGGDIAEEVVSKPDLLTSAEYLSAAATLTTTVPAAISTTTTSLKTTSSENIVSPASSQSDLINCNHQSLLAKVQIQDSPGSQSQCPKVYVKPAALCDVREKIFTDPRRLRKSYGVNALNRLSTMERALRRTVATSRTLQASLEGRLVDQLETTAQETRCALETLRLRCRALKLFVEERRTALENEKRELAREQELVAQIEADLEARQIQCLGEYEEFQREREELNEYQAELENVGLFRRQVALICELDDFIYPIVQVPNGSGYTICSVLVPSMEELKDPKKRPDDQMISTGMAYVFHLVSMLSIFTGVPLIYPLKYDRNNPVVVDVTIDSYHQKEFPLWVKGKDRVYFEHAVPLLGRNVSHLRVHFGLTSMRGRLMAGLHGLMKFFKTQRMSGITTLSVTNSIAPSELTVSDSNFSSRCVTPERSTSPQRIPHQITMRLKGRVHSSVPNLTSTQLVADILDDVERGSASDHAS